MLRTKRLPVSSPDGNVRQEQIWSSQADLITGLVSNTMEVKTQLKVHNALATMRKACTQPNKSQLELSKYNNYNTTSLKTMNIPYCATDPLTFRSFNSLMKDAKANYTLLLTNKRFESDSGQLGKPRSIFPELVNTIKLEEELRQEQHDQIYIDELNQSLTNGSTLGNFVRAKTASSTSPTSKNRNGKVPSDDIDNGGRNTSRHTSLRRPNTATDKTDNNLRRSKIHDSNDYDVLNERASTAGLTQRYRHHSKLINSKRISVIDKKISIVRTIRDRIQAEKEMEVLKAISLREHKNELRIQQQKHMEVQKTILIWIKLITFISPLLSKISKRRDEIYAKRYASAAQKSVHVIETWWWGMRLNLRIKRNPVIMNKLSARARRFWAVQLMKRARVSADLCKQFIKDSTGISETIRKVYAFRGKILKIQRYVRSYIKIQQARMQVLWIRMDKMAQKREEVKKIQRIRAETLALKAMSKMQHFGDALIEINALKQSLDKLLIQQSKNMVKTLESQKSEDKATKQVQNLEEVKADITSYEEKKLKAKLPWYQRVAKQPGNKHKLHLLYDVLKEVRLKWQQKKAEEGSSTKVFVEVKIDVKQARELLSNPVSSITAAAATKQSTKFLKKSTKSRIGSQLKDTSAEIVAVMPSVFLMLIGEWGAIAALECLSNDVWLSKSCIMCESKCWSSGKDN